jgi:hypothetical protein
MENLNCEGGYIGVSLLCLQPRSSRLPLPTLASYRPPLLSKALMIGGGTRSTVQAAQGTLTQILLMPFSMELPQGIE